MSAAQDARRRSTRTRLHPHTHASEPGQAVASCRSPRLHPHPQIHAGNDGDGVARRHGPRLHLQVHASGEGDGVALRRSARPRVHAGEEASRVTLRSRPRRRRGSSPAALSSPLEDDDLLWEILLRLPLEPSSLPRASAVCKRWRCAATDPRFHRRFYAHHRKPPLIGFFEQSVDGIVFKPVLDPPNRIPGRRFQLRLHSICRVSGSAARLLGCRHGRVLVMDFLLKVLIVVAPITGTVLCVPFPPKFKMDSFITGTVLCAAADHDHVHGSCHLSPFKVVLLSMSIRGPQPAFAHVYSSETGVWSDRISTPTPPKFCHTDSQGSLIGTALYWLCRGGDYILKFDLVGHILAVIRAPPITNDVCYQNGSH